MSLKQATLFLALLWTTAKGTDVDVSCVFMESCVLPCAFTPGPKLVIHWTKEPGNIVVHSYYEEQHQLNLQHENYTGRTSLSDQGISTGDASLQLHKVNVSDEGRYKCYIGTDDGFTESNVNLRVYAPVSEVSLQQEEERLLCRSENIYPKPNLTWTPSPEPLTDFISSETGLFTVNSSVPLTQRPLEEYSCNISTKHSWRSATYRRNPPVNSTGSEETVISCASNPSNASNAPTRSLVWTVNSTQTIVEQTGSELVYSETWDTFAKLLDSGDLRLEGLTEEHTGLYSCKRTTDRETFFIHTQLTVPGNQGNLPLGLIIGGTLGVLIAIAAAVVIYVRCCQSPPANPNAPPHAPPNPNAPLLDQDALIENQNAHRRSTERARHEGPENNHSLLQPLKNGDPNWSGAAVGYDAEAEEDTGLDRPEETDKLKSEDVSSEGDSSTET